MMFMTAKVDLKKVLAITGILAGLIIAGIWFFGGNEASPTVSGSVSDNNARVQFLKDMGWEVSASPTESSQVRIPKETSEVFDRYNALQKSQGYDLSAYAGKTVMRYVYRVNNYPGATEPVYATLLIYKNQVIGGDVTDTAPGGQIRGLKNSQGSTQTTPTNPTGAEH